MKVPRRIISAITPNAMIAHVRSRGRFPSGPTERGYAVGSKAAPSLRMGSVDGARPFPKQATVWGCSGYRQRHGEDRFAPLANQGSGLVVERSTTTATGAVAAGSVHLAQP
jgi:hypothetical protein